MSDKPLDRPEPGETPAASQPDHSDETSGNASDMEEEVQDYLDLLLNPAEQKAPEQASSAESLLPPNGPVEARAHMPLTGAYQPDTVKPNTANLDTGKHDIGTSDEAPVSRVKLARPAAPLRPREQHLQRRRLDGAPKLQSEPQLQRYVDPIDTRSLQLPLPKLAPEAPEPAAEPSPAETLPADKLRKPITRTSRVDVGVSDANDSPDNQIKAGTSIEDGGAWLANGRPHWGQESFECLLFSVGGLTLAVPLVELGSIYPLGEELTPIFGQIEWFMGLLPVKTGNIKTVDTAKVVMPERYRESMREDFSYVISINGVDWGLAVDSVANAITLDPEGVRWRSERSKRPWLAGTVIDHMCALLDVSQLAQMFQHEDRVSQR